MQFNSPDAEAKSAISGIVLVVVAVAVALFGGAWLAYSLHATFAPKYATVDRQVYENSASHVEGVQQNLELLREHYAEATTRAQRDVIRSTVQDEFGGLPENVVRQLQPGARRFLEQMLGEDQ